MSVSVSVYFSPSTTTTMLYKWTVSIYLLLECAFHLVWLDWLHYTDRLTGFFHHNQQVRISLQACDIFAGYSFTQLEISLPLGKLVICFEISDLHVLKSLIYMVLNIGQHWCCLFLMCSFMCLPIWSKLGFLYDRSNISDKGNPSNAKCAMPLLKLGIGMTRHG